LRKKLSKATDKEIDEICTRVGAKYLELGLELMLLKEQVDAFEKDYRYCHPITRHIIKTWITEQETKATWEALGDILYEIGCDTHFIRRKTEPTVIYIRETQ